MEKKQRRGEELTDPTRPRILTFARSWMKASAKNLPRLAPIGPRESPPATAMEVKMGDEDMVERVQMIGMDGEEGVG